jgi:hypothetical protein
LNTNKLKGGKGCKAPYKSTHVRIPDAIKPAIVKFADIYRRTIVEGDDRGTKQFPEYLETITEGIMFIDGILRNAYRIMSADEFKKADMKIRELMAIRDLQHQNITDLINRLDESKVILTQSLELKPNAGGAIKKEIKKVLKIIG